MDHHRETSTGTPTNPGGGREENPPEIDNPITDPSNPANPVDGAPSPGPQPGSTDDHGHDHDHGRHA